MAKLTEKQKKDYIESGGNKCPNCKSDNIEGGPFNTESSEAWQKVWCTDCHEEWTDVYKLTEVEEE